MLKSVLSLQRIRKRASLKRSAAILHDVLQADDNTLSEDLITLKRMRTLSVVPRNCAPKVQVSLCNNLKQNEPLRQEWLPGTAFIDPREGPMTVGSRSTDQICKLASKNGLDPDEYGITWIYAVKRGKKTGKVRKLQYLVG